MLDPRLEKIRFMSSLIGHEQQLLKNMTKLLKCYYHLHPLVEFKKVIVD
jgi:hypothetical protein